MKAKMLILAALALAPAGANAHDGAHQATAHGKAEGGQSGGAGHAQGIGKPGDPKKVSRTIRMLMSDDMRFTPANIEVKRGETIRFAVRNAGKLKHEMVLGSMAELKQHAEMMRNMPGMEHADPNMLTLEPGKTGELIWRFTRAGAFDFGCLQAGHFEAGMTGKISVK